MTPLPRTTVDAPTHKAIQVDSERPDAEDASCPAVIHRVGVVDLLALALLLLGAANWGVVAIFGSDWIGQAFGEASSFTRTLHAAIGISALYAVGLIARLRSAG
jgi:uncharacterized membrane protein YuzA (DUF378 family)